jgi:hypothetical protein
MAVFAMLVLSQVRPDMRARAQAVAPTTTAESARAPAIATPASGALAWLFPTEATPAEVAPGATLRVRVRLATALTPPPGIQQAEALARWSGTLARAARRVDGAGAGEARYALAVTDVRPDAGTTLAYRATLPLPAWLPPGAYLLSLATPGGGLDGARVRVRTSDGEADSVHGGPEASGFAVLASGRASVSVANGEVTWFPAGSLGVRDAPEVVGIVRDAPGATARWVVHPAPLLAPRLRVAPGGRVRAGQPVELRVDGIDAGARVAWRVGERSVAWGPRSITHAFVRGGQEEVVAVVVAPDGRSASVRQGVSVAAATGSGCAVAGTRNEGGGFGWCFPVVALAVSKSARVRSGWNRLRRGCRFSVRCGSERNPRFWSRPSPSSRARPRARTRRSRTPMSRILRKIRKS